MYAALVALSVVVLSHQDSAAELIRKARAAYDKGQLKEALDLINKAIETEPSSSQGHLARGGLHDAMGEQAKAVDDFTTALRLDPKNVRALDQRGSSYFKLGKIQESLADFDHYLAAKPDQFPGHWRRGITLYYAGKYEEGAKQFASYEKVDTNDVENAVWHFLCVARKDGVAAARAKLLKIGLDRRVPLMTVYDLFAGKAKPDDVLTACQDGMPTEEQRKTRLFYAHLYLSLYFEIEGNPKKSLEHIQLAADKYKNPHYMGDVARVHKELREKEK